MAHTSGHWYTIGRTVFSDEDGAICHMERSNRNTAANARLIAAAPDMLAALRHVHGAGHNAVEIQAAIALATGTQS